MKARFVFLPGDGIGPEVVNAAGQVIAAAAERYGHFFETQERLIGGVAIDECGTALPEETLAACRNADAVLLGAVGGPKWDDPAAAIRPEQGLLGIRKGMGLFANLRPVKPHPALLDASPLRPERLANVDMVVVRELTGGVYFGEPRGRRPAGGEVEAFDTMVYRQSEIRRIASLAFKMARGRRRKVTSVDKANVLESSRLWRQTVVEVAREYPDVTLEHVLVDAAAMFLVTKPAHFDVIVTENLFGDILTDEAAVLGGSMGTMPSASLGDGKNRFGLPRGLYEPIHGSAPDIAGRGVANPIGTILSAALLFRHSLGLQQEAMAIECAVACALSNAHRTADLGGKPGLTTQQMTDVICGYVDDER
jgi:3-isopropylmalate dehydrogenase